MKKLSRVLTLGAASLLFLTACGGEAAENNTDSTDSFEAAEGDGITVWTWDPYFNVKALEIAEGYYLEDNPDFNLNIIENAQEDIYQRLNTSLSSGVTKGLPNIVFIEDGRAAGYLNAYEEYFFPVGEYYNQDDFASYKVNSGQKDGEVYSFPFDSGVTGMYVRTDLLEEAGVTLEELTDVTWDEYVEIGKKVTEATGVKWMTTDHNSLGLMNSMLQSSGLWLTEEDGVTPNVADNEGLKEAFRIYKDMADADILHVHTDWNQFVASFNNGEVATVPQGNWLTPSIKAEASQSGNWAVLPFPRQSVEGSVNASNQGGSSIYVLDIEGKEEAAEFLAATFGSNIDFYQDLITEIGALGTYEPASSGDAYALEDDFFGGQTIYQDFAEWTQQVPEVNFGINGPIINDILSNSLQEYLNGQESDAVLENAQKQAESAIQ